jgi:hypothetical protein
LIYPDGKEKSFLVESGTYRLLVAYQVKKSDLSEEREWLKVYSNDFAIGSGK